MMLTDKEVGPTRADRSHACSCGYTHLLPKGTASPHRDRPEHPPVYDTLVQESRRVGEGRSYLRRRLFELVHQRIVPSPTLDQVHSLYRAVGHPYQLSLKSGTSCKAHGATASSAHGSSRLSSPTLRAPELGPPPPLGLCLGLVDLAWDGFLPLTHRVRVQDMVAQSSYVPDTVILALWGTILDGALC